MAIVNPEGNGILVPHLGKTLTFILPFIDDLSTREKGSSVMETIDEKDLLRPTTAQTLSLLNLVLQNPDEEHCKNIIQKLRNYFLWTSTENLYTSKGIIIYDNVDGKMPSDRDGLLKLLEEGNKAVKLVPYGFKRSSQPLSEFVKNPYVIAQAGDLPEEMISNVADKINKYGVHDVDTLDHFGTEDMKRPTSINLSSGTGPYAHAALCIGEYPEYDWGSMGGSFGIVK
jgi:hypothetical protein